MASRLALALAVLAGCADATASGRAGSGSGPGSGSGSDAPSSRFEHDMLVRFHMHENFGLVRAIERLLLRGKLDEARELAHGIAIAPEEPGMTAWAAQATRVRERAAALASAKTLDEALVADAKLASECASCHVASGVMPEFGSPPALPPDRPTVEARMTRHLWASERLWEGLVGGADDSWRAGLDVLALAPLPASQVGPDRAVFARNLQRLAETARKLRTNDHSAAYAEILSTCVTCHTAKKGT